MNDKPLIYSPFIIHYSSFTIYYSPEGVSSKCPFDVIIEKAHA